MNPLRSLAAGLLLFSCATLPNSRAVDSANWQIVTSSADPEIDALAERFYGGAFAPQAFAAEVNAALLKSPHSGTLHEILGYLAVLNSDSEASWRELLLAAFDTTNVYAGHDLWESRQGDFTLADRKADLEALAILESKHPDANLRSLATFLRANELRLLGRLDEAQAETARLQLIGNWKLIGAFDNEEGRGFSALWPPEKAIDLQASVPGAVVPLHWRNANQLDLSGAVPLDALVSPSQNAVAYLLTYVKSAQDEDALLRVSSSAPLIAWVNDAEVAREERIRYGTFDNVRVQVRLRAGWNKLLLKSAVKTGGWNAAARFTDLSGEPLLISTSAEPPATPIEAGAAVAPTPAATPRGARAELLQMRELVRRGSVHEAAEKLGAAANRQPENPLLRLFAAEVLRSDSQVEKALDLLSRGIDGETHPAPEILLRRASIYRERSLHEQAETDLKRAIDLNPNGRVAQEELAGLYGLRGWQQERRAVLEKALQQSPDAMNLRVELAECLTAQAHTQQAMAVYTGILKLEPGNITALQRLRDFAEGQTDLKSALADADQLRRLRPFNIADALAYAELLRRNDDAAASEKSLLALSQQSPDLGAPYWHRAVLAEEAGESARALSLWEEAAERDPNDSFIAERLDHLKPHELDVARKYIPTDAQIDAAVKRASSVERLPGSQMALLFDSEAVQLNSDGSSKRYVVNVSTAFTQNGRDALIQAQIPGRGKNRVLAAYAVQPNGSRQEASSITRTGVRFRKLEIGSTVVLRYISYVPKVDALPGEYYDRVALTSYRGQVEESSYTLITPHGRAVSVEATSEVKRTDSSDGDWDVRRFEILRAPAQVYEQSMTPAVDYLQRVSVSTLPDWDKFVAWEKAILLDSFRPDPQIRALALKLTEGAQTQQEKVDRLFHFVAQEIRYQQDYESILAGWQPHAATVVLERKYGDCKDKATLFISLARELGIDGEFVVLPTHGVGKLPKNVVLPFFDHAIAYLPEQPGIAAQFVDNTVDALDIGNLRSDDQGSSALILDPKAGSFHWLDIPYQAPGFQHEQYKISIQIPSADSARATGEISLRGNLAAHIRTALRDEVQAQKLFANITGYIFPRSTLLNASAQGAEAIDKPVVINTESDLSSSVSTEGDHYRLNLPRTFPLSAYVTLAARKTRLDLGAPVSSEFSVEATLGAGLRMKAPPDPVSVKSSCFQVDRKVELDGQKLKISDRFERKCVEISTADYTAFRADVEKASGALDEAIVFEKIPGPKPRR